MMISFSDEVKRAFILEEFGEEKVVSVSDSEKNMPKKFVA